MNNTVWKLSYKTLLKGIIIVLLIFLLVLTTYKLLNNDSNDKYYFIYNEINTKKEYQFDQNLKEKYNSYIITEPVLSIEYDFYNDKNSITGYIYINDEYGIYISDTNSNLKYKISNIKFETLYSKNNKYSNIRVYAISEDNKLYVIQLNENNIFKTTIKEVNGISGITNFVNLEYKSDKFTPSNSIFVRDKFGNIFDANSLIGFSEDIISIFDNVYVFKDKTMSTKDGYVLNDVNNNPYKIKSIFFTDGTNLLIEGNPIIIITEDNKFIYVYSDMKYIYEFAQRVKNVTYEKNEKYKITLEFEDGNKETFLGMCSEYFCE